MKEKNKKKNNCIGQLVSSKRELCFSLQFLLQNSIIETQIGFQPRAIAIETVFQNLRCIAPYKSDSQISNKRTPDIKT